QKSGQPAEDAGGPVGGRSKRLLKATPKYGKIRRIFLFWKRLVGLFVTQKMARLVCDWGLVTKKFAKPVRATSHVRNSSGLRASLLALMALAFFSSCAAANREVIFADEPFSAERYRCIVVAPFENQ